MVIVVGIGHGDTSSHPGRDWLNSKPVKLRLKIDLVSYPAWAEELVNLDKLSIQSFMQAVLWLQITNNNNPL